MRVCYLAGASTIHTVRWLNAMAARGHDVHLITMHPSELDNIDGSIPIHVLKIPAPIGYYGNVLEVRMLLRKIKPDLLHVHYASGYGTLARLVSFHPTLLSVWGSDVYLFPYKSAKNNITLQKNLSHTSGVTATGFALGRQTSLFMSAESNIDIVPFGIDLERFQSDNKFNSQEDTIVIGTVKRMKAVYGIDILIRAVANLIDYLKENQHQELVEKIRLLIVGNGPQLEEMQELAENKGIAERTQFIGAVPNEQVPEYINRLDIYCALSRSESFGVAVLEASACEVPVVVSDVGGLPEVVKHGETGFVTDIAIMDEVVARLYELVIDKEKRKAFGRNGRNFVQTYYDWNSNVDSMENIYKKLI